MTQILLALFSFNIANIKTCLGNLSQKKENLGLLISKQ